MEFLRRTQIHLFGRIITTAGAVTFSGLVSVALLPLATRVLHASDYGTYALLMSIVTLVGTAMDGGATLLLPEVLQRISTHERSRLIGSVTGLAATGAVAAGLMLVGLWVWQHVAFAEQPLPTLIIVLTAILMPLRAITSVSVVALMVMGRSNALAAQIAGQATAVFVGTLIALFGFSMNGASLFVGALSGQVVAMGTGLIVLRYYKELSLPSFRWIRRAVAVAPTSATAAFVDGTRCFFENMTITSVNGLHAVGILSHARLYYTLISGFGGSVSQCVWSRSLEEARNPHAEFDTTRRAWVPLQMAFVCASLIFVFFGRPIVDIISNGRLTGAADYVPVLLVLALLQITAQPAAAIVYSSGRAASATWFRTAIGLCNLALLYPVVMLFGIKGALALCVVESAAYRLSLTALAARDRAPVFHDQVAVFGCCAVFLTMALVHWTHPTPGLLVADFLASIAMLAIVGRHAIHEMVTAVSQFIPSLTGFATGRPDSTKDQPQAARVVATVSR